MSLKRTIVRPLILIALSIVLISLSMEQANASQVTLYFSGTVDLTVGGPLAPFSGSVTWDSSTPPYSTGLNSADYYPTASTFVLNSISYNISVAAIEIIELPLIDEFISAFAFSPLIDLGAVKISNFQGMLQGPPGMFSSTTLPSDLSFLNSTTSAFSYFADSPHLFRGSFVPSAVPEPTSMLLLGLGLVGLAGVRRKFSN